MKQRLIAGITAFIMTMLIMLQVSTYEVYAFGSGTTYTSPYTVLKNKLASQGYNGSFKYVCIKVKIKNDTNYGVEAYNWIALATSDLQADMTLDYLVVNDHWQYNLAFDRHGNTSPGKWATAASGPLLSTWSTGISSNIPTYTTDLVTDWSYVEGNASLYHANTGVILHENVDELDDYIYFYDTDIPDVTGASVDRKYLTKIGAIQIGLSDVDYITSWDIPADTSLLMEIDVNSQFGPDTSSIKRFRMQKVGYPYPGHNVPINSIYGKYEFNINELGRYLYLHAWGGKETLKQAIPQDIYLRYVKKDQYAKVLRYGDWTKVSLNITGQGIMGTVINNVTSNISEDDNGNITMFEDIPTEDNQTIYKDYNGNQVSEENSYNAYSDSIGVALDNSVTALHNVTAWFGTIPQLIGATFTFLPPEILAFIGICIGVLFIMKIAGR